MTHHAMITQNLPQLHDDSSDSDFSRYSASSSNSYGEQLLDMVDHCAGTEGARPAETHTARAQVMDCLKVVEERERASKRAVMGNGGLKFIPGTNRKGWRNSILLME